MAPYATDLLISFSENPQNGASDSSLSYDSLLAKDPEVSYLEEVDLDVQLEVEGSAFVLPLRDFHKLASLPWQRIHGNAYRLEGGSPEAFEKCLDYVLFASLPKRKRLSVDEREALVSMAHTLNLVELVDHLVQNKRPSCLGALFGCKTSKAKHVEQRYGGHSQRSDFDCTKSFTTF